MNINALARILWALAPLQAADLAGHHGVGLLLETCLADKLACAERTRRLLRHVVEHRIAERAAG